MTDSLFEKVYNPDILNCIANLSNDEVFTPPKVVNEMLDMLPAELFEDPNTKFLDPACKTGVFLREIAKRLIKGLQSKIPDLNERLNHIFKNQLYGIAITELTSLLSRRSLYCSKYPNGSYSVCKFDTAEGNIRFKRIRHKWSGDKCAFCGANKGQYERGDELETHAYEWIHTVHPEEIFNMKFDVIISNPPYQLNTGGSKSQAIPIYQNFIYSAFKLNPKFVVMIIPDRWVAGGFGLNQFRNDMLHDTRIRKLTDYIVASDCFPGVDIPGGICYFLWDRDNCGDCEVTVCHNNTISTMKRPLLEKDCDVFIKYNESISIINKIKIFSEQNIVSLISSQRPFGLPTNYVGKSKQSCGDLRVYGRNQSVTFIEADKIKINRDLINGYKVFLSAAYGERIDNNLFVIGKPFIGYPKDICTETYVVLGKFEDEECANNFISYAKTKFFRFLVLLHKPTQHLLKNTYAFVPMQDFSKPLTDEFLYAKYNLSDEEIQFIESMIRPME